MTAVQIEKALAEIVIDRKNACAAKIQKLPREAVTEKKALLVEEGMYSLCLNAGLLYHTTGSRENVIANKCRRMPVFVKKSPDPALEGCFSAVDSEEKLRMTAALYGEVWMWDQILCKYRRELAEAEAHEDAAAIPECRIKVQVIASVLSDWQKWRVENNIYPDLARTDYGKEGVL